MCGGASLRSASGLGTAGARVGGRPGAPPAGTGAHAARPVGGRQRAGYGGAARRRLIPHENNSAVTQIVIGWCAVAQDFVKMSSTSLKPVVRLSRRALPFSAVARDGRPMTPLSV